MKTVSNREEERKKNAATNDLISDKPNLSGDWLNFFLLILLYTMQGLPMGLAISIPITLQSTKNVTYLDQALFNLIKWPFILKLLWAPLVDALYFKKIGRRKSWLIPIQFCIGACFFYMANNIEDMLPKSETPKLMNLVCIFIIINFMIATHDIVVDGWALTLLKKRNVGYASTCNTAGVAIGMLIGSVCFSLLTSEDFCNKYLRITASSGGIMTVKSLLLTWFILIMVITLLIAFFKKENNCTLEDDYVKLNVIQNYLLLWKIIKLPNIQKLALAMFTIQIGFAASENVSSLKLIDAGISKDDLMSIKTLIFLVRIIIPLVIGKHTSGPKPVNVLLNTTLIKLLWNIPHVIMVYFMPILIKKSDELDISIYYIYAIPISVMLIHDIITCMMIVSITSFYSQISDPRFGSTYMTMFYTISYLGVFFSSLIAFGMIDFLTYKTCSFDAKNNNCSTPNLKKMCTNNGGECIMMVNGYYVEMGLCTVFGFIWYGVFRNILIDLQTKLICSSQRSAQVDVKKPSTEQSKPIDSVYCITVTR